MVSYRFCTAATEAEREQVHLLNYEIFVEEIPQHQPNPERRLVDRFHGENTYFQCWRDNELVGMVCTRDKRPSRSMQSCPIWMSLCRRITTWSS